MTAPTRGGGRGPGRAGRTTRFSGRNEKTRVRTAKKRSGASTRWLERQLNDPYVAEARRRGFRSRAAFKLVELDSRFGLLKAGGRVVDLGAAPGGWTQVAAEKVGPNGRVVACDVNPMDPVPGAETMVLDILDEAAPARLTAALGGRADLVMSDMAAPATGHAATDHLRIVALAEAALDFAEQILRPGGAFLAKVLQGGSEKSLLDRLKKNFQTVRHAKPPASRADSAETYVVAKGFRPPANAGADAE